MFIYLCTGIFFAITYIITGTESSCAVLLLLVLGAGGLTCLKEKDVTGSKGWERAAL